MDDSNPSACAKSFADFLADRLELSPEERPRAGQWSGTGNTIGSLGLRLGLLTLERVGQIVDAQAANERLFGETAVALGYMTQHQVERVLQLQRFHRCLDVGGILVMRGRLELPTLLNLIAEFFERELDLEAE